MELQELESYYREAFEEGRRLKETIEQLEAKADAGEQAALSEALQSLDRLVDDLMLASRKVKKELQKTVTEYRAAESENKEAMSSRIEDLATSLLCFSLSHFRDQAR